MTYPKCIMLILLFSTLVACGRKGPPLPPLTIIPEAITDVRTVVRDDGIYILWTPPVKNIDGSPLENLKGFKVLRSEQSLAQPCVNCKEIFEPVYDLFNSYPAEGAGEVERGGFRIFDNRLKHQTLYRYKVISYNTFGYLSPDSNITEVLWDIPTSAPPDFGGESGDRFNYLHWRAPETLLDGRPVEGLYGYNLYRAEKTQAYDILPINSEPLTLRYYMDTNLENNRKYYYVVRSVRLVMGTFIESPPSNEILLVPKDIHPPQPPFGVIAIPEGRGIRLKWKMGLESDLAGYNVYRRSSEEKRWIKLNKELLTEPAFFDNTVKEKKIYIYRVTAVDGSPSKNESEPSKDINVFLR